MGKTNAKEEAFCRWHSPRRQGHASARRGFSGMMACWSAKLGLLALLLLLPAIGVLAQKTVKGTVKSQDGEPLIGVSVLVKGTGSGSTTDMNGAYTVNARTGQTLVFSYVGFTSKTLKVNGPTLNVTLDEDSKSLEDVVVIGYGVQKKKLVTGATVQVKGDAIAHLNTDNPLQAMQGQTPGVSIASTSGQPGSDMKVAIRGLGTVGNSAPLYLIDGVGGDIATLNPSDIESIDILKDAASAAIYGAQAANGVVLITTKSGKEGKTEVSYDGYYGWQNVARKAKMLNAEEYKTIMDEAQLNSGNAAYDWASMKSIWNADGSPISTNWVGEMFKDNAKMSSHTLGITGGTKISTFALSLGYLNQEGIVGGSDVSDYSRYNFRINSEHKAFGDFLKVGEQASFIYKKNKGIGVGNQYNNTLRGAFATSPLAPVYSDNNIYDSPYNDTSSSDWYKSDGNPYGSMMTKTNNKTLSTSLSANAYAEIQPIKRLKIKTVLGVLYNTTEYRGFTPLYQFSPYDYNSTATKVDQNMNHGLNITWQNTATYDWKIADHAFNALLGMESSRYEGTYLGGHGVGLKEGYDNWSHAYLSNTTGTSDDGMTISGSPNDQTRTVSYFGRLGWNWKEIYMVNATLRCDGSSRFASGHRFGWFPSVSAGWTVTGEKFMEQTKSWLDFLKIRGSWGQVGNQNIDNYQYLAPISMVNNNYIFGTTKGSSAQSSFWGAYPSRLANEDLTWETSEQTDLGFDARFLNSRLGVNFDWYYKKTKDWLVQSPILATTGTGAPYINGGDVTNKGVELAFTWNDHLGDFNYNASINGSYNKNRVGKIPTEDGIIHGSTGQLYDNSPEFYRAENGHAIGYFWGYKATGIFQNKEEIQNWIAAGNGVLQSNPEPGDVKYVDVNHDGVINDADKVDLGNGSPDFTMGFTLGFNWKNFDFSVNANGAFGMQIVQSYRNQTNAYANYTTRILDRWTGEGTSNCIPRVTTTNINWQFSSLYVHDADYLRISTITLGYDFAKLIKCKYISQARLYAQVQNAFTFTKYDGMDPEIGYGTDGWVSGIDVGYYPRPRTVLFGVNLKF
jgi:TonB-linked SusC/RagA family outer membrane protein